MTENTTRMTVRLPQNLADEMHVVQVRYGFETSSECVRLALIFWLQELGAGDGMAKPVFHVPPQEFSAMLSHPLVQEVFSEMVLAVLAEQPDAVLESLAGAVLHRRGE